MIVAIPTYRRSQTIEKNALHFVLQELGIPPVDVYLFVSNDDEYHDYKHLMQKYLGLHIVISDVDNARDKFNHIHTYFNSNEHVLLVEDDVKGIVTIIDQKPRTIIDNGFKLMQRYGKSIWGIYPSSNKLFMKPNVLTGFGFIVANIYGFVADGDTRILVQEQCKTDYERSLLYSLHKDGVVRLNYVAAKTNNYTNKGGMQTMSNRAALEQTSCDNLVRKYPQYIGYKNGTKSMYCEIKLLK